MMHEFMRKTLLIATIAAFPLSVAAENWTLDGAASKVAFGSVKKDTVGEVHHFTGLSGSVDGDGSVEIEIDLTSVETLIDIRNERMRELVFGDATKAILKAAIDSKALEAMAPGGTKVIDVKGTLSLLGKDIPVEASTFVARLSDKKALITTDEMIMLSTADAGLDGGVDALQKVAKLSGITRVSPVTLRLVFNRGGDAPKTTAATSSTAAATTTAAAAGGDAVKGKKVFKKCKACHVLDAEKNRVGPHLVGIIGRPVGAIDGFKYSKAMTEWGGGKSWTPELLAEFLTKPKALIKGTKMAFPGLRKEEDRENIIAYMNSPE